jgi:hypothetical protein
MLTRNVFIMLVSQYTAACVGEPVLSHVVDDGMMLGPCLMEGCARKAAVSRHRMR